MYIVHGISLLGSCSSLQAELFLACFSSMPLGKFSSVENLRVSEEKEIAAIHHRVHFSSVVIKCVIQSKSDSGTSSHAIYSRIDNTASRYSHDTINYCRRRQFPAWSGPHIQTLLGYLRNTLQSMYAPQCTCLLQQPVIQLISPIFCKYLQINETSCHI